MENQIVFCQKDNNRKSQKLCETCPDMLTCEDYRKVSGNLVSTRMTKAKELDEKINILKDGVFDNYYDMGDTLRELRDGMLYKDLGYESLEEYAQKNHGFKARKASYLIAIVENCIAAGIKKEEIRGIEWGKMRELPELTEVNRKDWLLKAKEMSVEELKNEVKKSRGGPGSNEEKKYLSFSLSLEQKDLVDRALDLAARLTGSEVKSYHLQILAEEFIGTYETEDEASINRFKNMYGD